MQITLQTNDREIMLGILKVGRSELNSALHVISYDIKRGLQKLTDKLLQSSEEYKAISGGVLQTQLHIDNSQEVLRDILGIVRNSVDTTVIPVSITGGSFRGGINISILRSGIDELISLSSGKYQGKLFNVPWLEWLLTQGDRILIAGYGIKYTPTSFPAQTGIAKMEQGGGWRIPSRFAGTSDSNWITRTFNVAVIQQEMNSIVEKAFKNKLG